LLVVSAGILLLLDPEFFDYSYCLKWPVIVYQHAVFFHNQYR